MRCAAGAACAWSTQATASPPASPSRSPRGPSADIVRAMTDTAGPLGSLRERNRLRIVDELRRAGGASRADLVPPTGLSRTTVSKLVSELQSEGIVVERREPEPDAALAGGGIGRPPVALALAPAAGGAIGVDFGHDFLRVAVADLSGAVLAEARRGFDVD